jgi:uncharacterized protein with GYD domain
LSINEKWRSAAVRGMHSLSPPISLEKFFPSQTRSPNPVDPQMEADEMATYVTFYDFTDQGIRAVKDSPARLKAAIQAAEAAGMKIHAAYYTVGPHDLVVISEADDEKAANAFTLATVSLGNVRSTTMRAWSPDEFEEIVGLMP